MENYVLLVTSCSDSMFWYANRVGDVVYFHGQIWDRAEWASRDNGGFINFVKFEDARLIKVGAPIVVQTAHFGLNYFAFDKHKEAVDFMIKNRGIIFIGDV